MKNPTLMLLTFIFILVGCEENNLVREENNFLGNKRVNVSYNLTLPQYSQLEFDGNSIFLADEINFIQGVYIFRANANTFFAFELAEPNSPIGSCSVPTKLSAGFFEYQCGSETVKYDTLGNKTDTDLEFNMRQYTAIREGQFLRIRF